MNRLTKLLVQNKQKAPHVGALVVENAAADSTDIYLYDSIVGDDETAAWAGGVSAQTLVPQIRGIKSGTINLRINSPGGDVFAAQAIVAAIRDTKATVHAHVDGLAASAATVIAVSADKITMNDGGLFMIHCAMTIGYGNAAEMRGTAALLDKVDTTIAGAYASRTGGDPAAMLMLMQAETWMTADEALSGGFINEVSKTAPVSANWDLSAYANAPEARRKNDPTPVQPEPEPEPAISAAEQEHRERQNQRLCMLLRTPISPAPRATEPA